MLFLVRKSFLTPWHYTNIFFTLLSVRNFNFSDLVAARRQFEIIIDTYEQYFGNILNIIFWKYVSVSHGLKKLFFSQESFFVLLKKS